VVTGPTIRRELVVLRAMFKLAGREKILSQDQIPYFPMPDDSEAAGEYITPEQFAKVLAALPDGKARGGKGTKGGPKSETNLHSSTSCTRPVAALAQPKRFSGTT